MVQNIGDEIGEFMEHELTPAAAKIRVLIDEFKPLQKETIVEFSGGDEVLVTLDYKGLKNHCHHCHCLSHVKEDCPGIKKDKDQDVAKLSTYSQTREMTSPRYSSNSQYKEQSYRPREKQSQQQSYNSFHLNSRAPKRNHFEAPRERTTHAIRHQDHRSSSSHRTHDTHHPFQARNDSREWRAHLRPKDNVARNLHPPSLQWKEKTLPIDLTRQDTSEGSRTRRPPLERNLEPQGYNPEVGIRSIESTLHPPIPTTEEVMGELREVTVQYMSVADPSESAARRQCNNFYAYSQCNRNSSSPSLCKH